jgi:hypothetical protein
MGETPEEQFMGETPEAQFMGETPEEQFMGETPEAQFMGVTPEDQFMGLVPPRRQFFGETPEEQFMGETPEEQFMGETPEEQFMGAAPSASHMPRGEFEEGIMEEGGLGGDLLVIEGLGQPEGPYEPDYRPDLVNWATKPFTNHFAAYRRGPQGYWGPGAHFRRALPALRRKPSVTEPMPKFLRGLR